MIVWTALAFFILIFVGMQVINNTEVLEKAEKMFEKEFGDVYNDTLKHGGNEDIFDLCKMQDSFDNQFMNQCVEIQIEDD